jgi:hypothetical protein
MSPSTRLVGGNFPLDTARFAFQVVNPGVIELRAGTLPIGMFLNASYQRGPMAAMIVSVAYALAESGQTCLQQPPRKRGTVRKPPA